MDYPIPRTQVDRLVLADHFVAGDDTARHFVLHEPRVIRPGEIISATDDDLAVEHLDGTVTHHPGAVELRCGGWAPLGSEIGRRVE